MKCNDCGKRMKTIVGESMIRVEGADVRVVHLPICECPDCGKREIYDIVLDRARAYAEKFGVENGQIDFSACENEQSGEDLAVFQTLGLL